MSPVTGPQDVFVALGSNLGDRHALLASARTAMDAIPQTRIAAASTIEETAPLGGRHQPAYLNQMVRLTTGLDPYTLLDHLQRIESTLGRVRTEHWGSRSIDLDIVQYGALTIQDHRLTLPHPGLAERDFWQRELAELHPT